MQEVVPMENRWNVEVTFEEDDTRTAATARLTGPNAPDCVGHGYSRRNPHDKPEPKIGEEVATARALSNLAHELLEKAAADIEAVTHQEAHLHA